MCNYQPLVSNDTNGPKLPSSNDPECCDAARRRRHSLRLQNQELAVLNQPRWLR
ncbi:MAG: hypothetical protein ACI9LZ_003879 [Glaciecola sp.]